LLFLDVLTCFLSLWQDIFLILRSFVANVLS
jgi:hypothetical protein